MRALKLIWNIISKIIVAFLVFILLCNIYIGIQKSRTDDPLPNVFGFASAVVISGSMQPTLNVNDFLIIREKEAAEYAVGDIVTFVDPESQNSALVTHRIIERDGDTITTKGDSITNNVPDTPFDVSCIKGSLFAKIPHLGGAMEFFKQPVGIVFLVIIGFLLVEIPYLIDRKRADRDREKGN